MNAEPHGAKRSVLVPLLTLCAIFAALTIPMAALGRIGTSEANDQQRYHWPTIIAMSEHWPTVSLEEYRTATGPLYHEVLAAVVSLTSPAQAPIRILNALASLPLVIVVFLLVRRHASPWLAALLALPFVLSAYPLSSAIWMTTDNAAMLFVLLALLVATSTASLNRNTAGSAIWSALATSVRQIHLWVVAPCALATFLRSRDELHEPWWRGALRTVPIALPACAIVALLFWWWGGLTPPYVEARNAAVGNAFAFGFTMSLIGLFGVFYLPIVQPWKDRALWRGFALPAVVIASVALTVLTATTHSKPEGRWGGPIWAVVDHLPAIANRSVVFPPLAALGGLFLLAACRRAALLGRSHEALVALAAIVCFTLAHAVQPWTTQRYFEPILLVMVAWLTSLAVEPADSNPNNARDRVSCMMWSGPAVLALIQLGLTFYSVFWQAHAADISS